MQQVPAGVAQLAEQPSCNGFNEPDLTCEQARITGEIWRAFAAAWSFSGSLGSLAGAREAGASQGRSEITIVTA
jgi:hypothetical protein